MARERKTWREKLADNKGLPVVKQLTGKSARRFGVGTMLLPSPLEVDGLMKRVPKGKLTTINHLRDALAKRHGATMSCPICTGIFAWIAAHAADESAAGGVKRITPYWRTLKNDGELNPKYPGGISALKAHLKAEGHHVIAKGKRFFVADFEKSLAGVLK